MRWSFRTVPEELLACAETCADHLSAVGYSVKVEKKEIGYPNTPTLWGKRANTVAVVEVVDRLKEDTLRGWAAYGRSCREDFRVIVALPESAVLPPKSDQLLRSLGLGCLQVSGGVVVERLTASDLGINIALPPLTRMPMKVRALLGPAYEKFDRGDWRDGFADACQAFEVEARRYFKRHTSTGRIKVLRKSGPSSLPMKEIDRLTMGQLLAAFKTIVTANLSDNMIAETLEAVNRDRIGVAHKKTTKRVETRLRSNVGRHMWRLYSGFQEVIK